MKKQVLIIPCSGIGKSLGSVGRSATYKIVDHLRPKETRTVCLPLVTIGDKQTVQLIKSNPCIVIDGCPLQCSRKNIDALGGNIKHQVIVTNVLRDNKQFKPEGVIKLNPEGEKLADIIAENVSEKVDEIAREDKK